MNKKLACLNPCSTGIYLLSDMVKEIYTLGGYSLNPCSTGIYLLSAQKERFRGTNVS